MAGLSKHKIVKALETVNLKGFYVNTKPKEPLLMKDFMTKATIEHIADHLVKELTDGESAT